MEFRDGILSQIFDKQSGEALFDTSLHAIGDVVALRSVGNGAGEFSTMQKPTTDHLESAAAINPRWELAETGPVYTLYRSVAPFENAEIVRTLRLYRNRKRIDFDTEIRNFDGTHYLEYRQLFPLRDSGHVAYGVPFGRVRVGIDEMQGAPGERYMDEAREIHPRTTSGWIAGESGGVAVGLATRLRWSIMSIRSIPTTHRPCCSRSCSPRGAAAIPRASFTASAERTVSASPSRPRSGSIG